MKSVIKFIIFVMLVFVVSSCTTTQKFMVEGTPGTKIYTPFGTCVGTIQNSGKTKIELPSDGYYAYMLSKDEKSDLFIPFALDYKKCSRIGVKAVGHLGFWLLGYGFVATLAGGYDMAFESGSGATLGTGLAAMAIGGSMLGTSMNRLKQTSYNYQFKYLEKQSTNNDFTFSKPVLASAPKKAVTKTKPLNESKKDTSHGKIRKTFKNYSAQLEGTYVGSGTLTLNGKVIELYTNALISLERIDDETVCVNVEEGGALFFDDCSSYKIKMTKNGYTLTHSEIANAVIKVKKNGQIEYMHPRVNIDGTNYTLSLSAQKQ